MGHCCTHKSQLLETSQNSHCLANTPTNSQQIIIGCTASIILGCITPTLIALMRPEVNLKPLIKL